MASETETTPADQPSEQLESGAYEIIRGRLAAQSKQLRSRLDQLNEARKQVFGSIDTQLLGTERVSTDNNCVPRDMVAIGDRFLFGYNVRFGLKTETDIGDVFAIYSHADGAFHPQPLDPLQDPQFERDFKEVYRYYKNAVFAKFFVSGAALYMVFRVGRDPSDTKTLKWHIDGDRLVYAGNRSDHEVKFPPQHDFQWIRTTREQQRYGDHPHISIDERVFVETVGGDLTIKIENNTESGEGIYAEDVENHDQTLDDAEIYYALVGNIILIKLRPYQEKDFRYIVYNEKIQRARRLDSIANACVLLPDDHGLIFSNGYYLQSGECKTFGPDQEQMLFERRLAAPNGEDYLYLFYNRTTGMYLLLQYNLIEQKVETPLACHGATFFEDGKMICFKASDEPQKHHAIQVWRTPYVSPDLVTHAETDSFLYKVGNKDIVRGMAECHEVLNLISKDESYANLYWDISRKAGDVIDAYFWCGDEQAFDLKQPLEGIRNAASSAIDEFEKVVRVRENTAGQTRQVQTAAEEILAVAIRRRFDNIDEFVETLAGLRRVRGDIIALKDLRYADLPAIEVLEQEVAETADRVGQRCVQFLLQPASLRPYAQRLGEHATHIDSLAKVSDARQLGEKIAAEAGGLEMLIEIISNLKIDDATHRTAIIDGISELFSQVNQSRAALKNRTQELLSVEGRAEFSSQMKLLNQGVVNYLDISDTPQRCEDFLTKVMVQLEELEGRFAEFDEFIGQLTDKREEIYNAFETRRLGLVESRNKRASALAAAADRILKGIKSRVEQMESVNDIHGYFASDLMIEKIRDIVRELDELDDTVKVDDIQSRLKTTREDAVRQLKDRQELFVDGKNVIALGKHKFTVNVQALDLTTVLRDAQLCLHLTGTNFYAPLQDPQLNALRPVWQQEVVSENERVYRGEYLAFQMLLAAEREADGLSLEQLRRCDDAERLATVQRFMAPRYHEAYSKGVHDIDASLLLVALAEMRANVGLLRHAPQARAMAAIYWRHFCHDRPAWDAKLRGVGAVAQTFPDNGADHVYVEGLACRLREFALETRLFPESLAAAAAQYAFEELTDGEGFVISRRAATLFDDFQRRLHGRQQTSVFEQSLQSVSEDPAAHFQLARDWAAAFLSDPQAELQADDADLVDELAALLHEGRVDPAQIGDGQVSRELQGFKGSHPLLSGGAYHLHYNRFLAKMAGYVECDAEDFTKYVQLKRELVETAKADMRLDEFRPRVLTSFVRNRLIDEVYLPLIGDNLAKQIGTAGEQKRTDRMGLLLLISPPGYGKTTLMEYIANRLGLIFMKINGPAIGHQVTSLDPAEAPNAGAREEVHKLNLALEMGDNVMLYVDDIQHCNPEFLQKFISLCDAQRKIEGVYRGHTKTYDLRGRKVAVVMAGNPYTESGEKFQIPDMLSNRADIYNLGEIIGDSADAFELSYLENALTSNPVLNRLATRSQKDIYTILDMARHGQPSGDLEGNYSLEELQEMTDVVKKLLRVRDVVLKVNRQYILSAAQSDDYRIEPPFKLQGSYRNMNRIAEKISPIMNDQELESLILSNYENDAQTLTSDTESNLLKLKEMLDKLTDAERQRWEDMKRSFVQNIKLRGVGSDDSTAQVLVQLSMLGDGLESVRRELASGAQRLADAEADSQTLDQGERLITQVGGLRTELDQLGKALTAAPQPAQTLPAPAAGAPAPPLLSGDFQPGAALHRVTVQHKVPRSILAVVRSQFELMSQWMQPLHQQQSQIQSVLQDLLTKYETLLEELENAKK